MSEDSVSSEGNGNMSYSSSRTVTCCARSAVIAAVWIVGASAIARGEMLRIDAADGQVALQRLDHRSDASSVSSFDYQPTLREACSTGNWLHVFGDRVHRAPSELDSKECHPAPEPSSLVIGLLGLFGLLRLRNRGR